MQDKGQDEFDFEEITYEDSIYEEEETVKFKPWMIPLLVGLVLLAVLICIPLWGLTSQKMQENKSTVELPNVILEDEATPTPGPTAEPSPEPTATPAPTPTVTPEPTATPAPTPTATPEPTATPAPTPTATPEPMATPTPGSDPTPTPEPVQEPVSGDTSMSFAAVSEAVTAKDVTNLRFEPSTENAENIVAQLLNGASATRVGINADTGWSKLEYNGQTVYAVSRYLTTDLGYKPPVQPTNSNRVNTQDGRIIIFTDCDDNITPKEYVNLRTEPSTTEGDSTVRCQISSGEAVHRTGYSADSGWSRVEYNGEILYVVSSYMVNVE